MPGVVDLTERLAQAKMRRLDLYLPPVAKCRGLLHNARIIVAEMEPRSRFAGRCREAWLDFIAERERALVALCEGAAPRRPQCESLVGPLAEPSWRAHFRRSRSNYFEEPRFVVRHARHWMYARDGYRGGHRLLDSIIAICCVHGYPGWTKSFYGPANPFSYETRHRFGDGGLEILAGNYMCGEGQGAYVVGFEALRWLLGELGLTQPRRLKGERMRSG